MAINETQIRGVHDTIRRYFKGKTKSSNKKYDPDTVEITDFADLKSAQIAQKKMVQRNGNISKAAGLVNSLRESKSYKNDDFLAMGFEVLDQEDAAGNCVEMAAAAAYLVMREGLGTAWFVSISDPGDHTFCLVDSGAGHHPGRIGGHMGFSVCGTDSWVIDPWANVCCKMRDYEALFEEKMRKWSKEGKRVRVKRPSDLICIAFIPAGREYMRGFRTGRLSYLKVGGSLPRGVPKALVPVIAEDAHTIKKGGCCVIL